MKSKAWFSIFLILLLYGCFSHRQSDEKSKISANKDMHIRGDFQKYFDNCGVEGTIAIYDMKNGLYRISLAWKWKRYLPPPLRL
jgi:beta-lactamase class D